MYIYCGKYYNDVLWLSDDFKSCGISLFSDVLPYVHYAFWVLQAFLVNSSGANLGITSMDRLVSDAPFLLSLSTQCPAYLLRHHPEMVDYCMNNQYSYLYANSPLVKEILKVESTMVVDSVISGYVMYLAILLAVYYVVIFYTSLGQSLHKDEASIDIEYLTLCSLAEAEKEVGSADDMIFFIINLVYLFGWFFGMYYYFIASRLPELVIFMYSIPGIFYIALSIPTYLTYDYGILYGAYLRGAGNTASLVYELGYDYIAIAVFYIRLALQSIRLVIMIVTYASFHDYILFYNVRTSAFSNASTAFASNASYSFVQTAFYYLTVSIPGAMLYFAYEILHLFFVLTSQTISFFAIIFWLFLFLYTFFFMSKVEAYFLKKRELRKSLRSEIY